MNSSTSMVPEVGRAGAFTFMGQRLLACPNLALTPASCDGARQQLARIERIADERSPDTARAEISSLRALEQVAQLAVFGVVRHDHLPKRFWRAGDDVGAVAQQKVSHRGHLHGG